MFPDIIKTADTDFIYVMPDYTTEQTYQEAVQLCKTEYNGVLPIVKDATEASALVGNVYSLGNRSIQSTYVQMFFQLQPMSASSPGNGNTKVWLGLRQRRPHNNGTACHNSACDSANHYWDDGTALVYDSAVFNEIRIDEGIWCTSFDARTSSIRSQICGERSTKTICRVDCRVGGTYRKRPSMKKQKL